MKLYIRNFLEKKHISFLFYSQRFQRFRTTFIAVLLVAGYHLNLETIQVLVRDAEVQLLSLVRLLLPPAVLAASHPNNQGNEAEMIEEHCSALCASDGLTMVKQVY